MSTAVAERSSLNLGQLRDLHPELGRRQDILRANVGRFALAGYPGDSGTEARAPEELEEWARVEAHQIVDEGVGDDTTVVEVRPFMTEVDLKDAKLTRGMHAAVTALRNELVRGYDVPAIFMSHPVMASTESNRDARIVGNWMQTAAELYGLDHQMRGDPHFNRDDNAPPRRRRGDEPVDSTRTAIVGVTPPAAGVRLFGGTDYTAFDLESGLVVLRHVGREDPRENALIPAYRPDRTPDHISAALFESTTQNEAGASSPSS
jgi:hypothetical protein